MARAKADKSPDGRFTHPTFESPGTPGGPTTTPTPYPKWVHGVIVQNPDEEAAELGLPSTNTPAADAAKE